jgi:WW domain-binding protein 4
MTTPWISRPRWTCKYCNVTINDDVPSRSHHENGLRHKGNVERSLREAYKKSQRERADEQHAKREMGKIERLAREAHALDGGGVAGSSERAQAVMSSTSKKSLQWKPADRTSAYGYALPVFVDQQTKRGEERHGELQEQAEAKRREGIAGEWLTVEQPYKPLPKHSESVARHAEQEPSPAEHFRVREKRGTYDDSADVDDLTINTIKAKKRVAHDQQNPSSTSSVGKGPSMLPQWTPLRLDTGISVKDEGVQAVAVRKMDDADHVQELDVKQESVSELPADIKEDVDAAQSIPAAEENKPAASSTSTMFKKRKAGAGAGAKKVRAII